MPSILIATVALVLIALLSLRMGIRRTPEHFDYKPAYHNVLYGYRVAMPKQAQGSQ